MIKSKEKKYWRNYYKSGAAPDDPSLFAQYVVDNYTASGGRLIELGCGNGRDAKYFAACGLHVHAIDLCEFAIKELTEEHGGTTNLSFKAEDFTRMPLSEDKFDIIYSRFTLHSVTAEGQERTLKWASKNLEDKGLLCIETRGQQNELYKRGEKVQDEEGAFIYEGHYRRFVDFDIFKRDIAANGLTILEANEETGYAPYKDTDYHFIRVIAQKI